MAVYKFNVTLEDYDDLLRVIEIKSNQTFEDLHKCILQAFGFDDKQLASFYMSDDYWRKGQEITLRKEDLPLDEDEIRKKVDPKKLMADIKIARYIEQPHQRFVYVFDPVVQWSFLIEMIKIADENAKLNYPAIVKTYGTAPKQYKQTNMAREELSPDMAMAGLLNDLEPEDEEIYKTLDPAEEAVEEDDINSLEGEEGEEEDTEENGEEAADDFGMDDHHEED